MSPHRRWPFLLAGFTLATAGVLIALPHLADALVRAGINRGPSSPYAFTWIIGGFTVAAAGALVAAHAWPWPRAVPPDEARWRRQDLAVRLMASGVGLIVLAGGLFLGYGVHGLCGFGCDAPSYWTGMSVTAAVAGAGVLLAAAAFPAPRG